MSVCHHSASVGIKRRSLFFTRLWFLVCHQEARQQAAAAAEKSRRGGTCDHHYHRHHHHHHHHRHHHRQKLCTKLIKARFAVLLICSPSNNSRQLCTPCSQRNCLHLCLFLSLIACSSYSFVTVWRVIVASGTVMSFDLPLCHFHKTAKTGTPPEPDKEDLRPS